MPANDTTEAARQQAFNRNRLQNRRELPAAPAANSAAGNDASAAEPEQKGFAEKFRSLRTLARQQQAASKGESQSAQSFAMGAATVSAKTLTAEFLRDSWLSIIPSFGLTLLYINFHFFQRMVGGLFPTEWFAAFGTEWARGQEIPFVSSFVGLLEIILLLVLDGVVIVLLLLVVLMISLVVQAALHPIEMAQQVLGNGILGFSDLYNMIWRALGSHS